MKLPRMIHNQIKDKGITNLVIVDCILIIIFVSNIVHTLPVQSYCILQTHPCIIFLSIQHYHPCTQINEYYSSFHTILSLPFPVILYWELSLSFVDVKYFHLPSTVIFKLTLMMFSHYLEINKISKLTDFFSIFRGHMQKISQISQNLSKISGFQKNFKIGISHHLDK